MGVPGGGNFDMYTASADDQKAIAGGIDQGGGTVSGLDEFTELIAESNTNFFDPSFAGRISALSQVSESIQYRNYPLTPPPVAPTPTSPPTLSPTSPPTNAPVTSLTCKYYSVTDTNGLGGRIRYQTCTEEDGEYYYRNIKSFGNFELCASEDTLQTVTSSFYDTCNEYEVRNISEDTILEISALNCSTGTEEIHVFAPNTINTVCSVTTPITLTSGSIEEITLQGACADDSTFTCTRYKVKNHSGFQRSFQYIRCGDGKYIDQSVFQEYGSFANVCVRDGEWPEGGIQNYNGNYLQNLVVQNLGTCTDGLPAPTPTPAGSNIDIIELRDCSPNQSEVTPPTLPPTTPPTPPPTQAPNAPTPPPTEAPVDPTFKYKVSGCGGEGEYTVITNPSFPGPYSNGDVVKFNPFGSTEICATITDTSTSISSFQITNTASSCNDPVCFGFNCFEYSITNTSLTTDHTYTFIDCSGSLQSDINIPADTRIGKCARTEPVVSSNEVLISLTGKCPSDGDGFPPTQPPTPPPTPAPITSGPIPTPPPTSGLHYLNLGYGQNSAIDACNDYNDFTGFNGWVFRAGLQNWLSGYGFGQVNPGFHRALIYADSSGNAQYLAYGDGQGPTTTLTNITGTDNFSGTYTSGDGFYKKGQGLQGAGNVSSYLLTRFSQQTLGAIQRCYNYTIVNQDGGTGIVYYRYEDCTGGYPIFGELSSGQSITLCSRVTPGILAGSTALRQETVGDECGVYSGSPSRTINMAISSNTGTDPGLVTFTNKLIIGSDGSQGIWSATLAANATFTDNDGAGTSRNPERSGAVTISGISRLIDGVTYYLKTD